MVQSTCNGDGESLNGKFDGAVMQIVGRRDLARTFSQSVCATWIQSYFSLELGIPFGGELVLSIIIVRVQIRITCLPFNLIPTKMPLISFDTCNTQRVYKRGGY